MKSVVCSASVVVLAVWLAGCGQSSAVPAAAGEADATAHRGAPQRKSGWWEFASLTQSGRALATQELCVSPATEATFSAFDQITQERLIGTKCSKADFQRNSGGWSFETACDTGIAADLGGGIVVSKGAIVGDVRTKYEIRMSVTQAGETHTGRVTAAWKSACPAGRKAGDLVIDGDTTVNVLQD